MANDQMQALLINVLQSRVHCTVALYYPTRGEPDLLALMKHRALQDTAWALPVCCDTATGSLLRFAQTFAAGPLVVGRYGIPVPAELEWSIPDVIVVPCLGFHRSGYRLGYGGGWYDRTLSSLPNQPLTIGIAFAATEAQENFAEPHDRPLDMIITEHETIRVNTTTGFQ